MIDSPSPYGSPYSEGGNSRPVNTLATEKISVEHKVFFLDLQENHRGRYLKITEDVGGRRDTLIIPIEAAAEFSSALQRVINTPV